MGFKLNIPDVVMAVLMLMLIAMTNNEVVANADIIATPVGVGDHAYSDHMLVVGDDINTIMTPNHIPIQNNHRGLEEKRGKCENDPAFRYKGKTKKDCSWVPSKDDNCRKSQEDYDGNQTGKQVKFYCPQECKSKCAATNPPTRGKCENDPDFLYKGNPQKDCSWVPSRDDNCRKSQEDSDGNQTGKQVKFYCPQECKSKCRG